MHSASYFHPLWKAYYGRFFDCLKVLYIPDDRPNNHAAITQLYNFNIPELLKTYSLVVVADIDEILVPDPDRYADLGDYLDRFTGLSARCVGYHIMEQPGDPPYDLCRRITDNRHYWLRDELYDKIVVTRQNVRYRPGNHTSKVKAERDDSLYMFHLRDANWASLHQRRPNVPHDAFLERQARAEPIPEKWRIV